MSIFRSTNPQDFDDVDGIIINESAPSPNIQGVNSNLCLLVGAFQRGPLTIQDVGSIGELHEMYGKSDFSGNVALKNKKFGRLRVLRAAAAAAAKATKAFQSSTTDRITFTAKYVGAYGNSITVTIASGTVSGKKYTIHDGNTGAVLADEVYDNVAITDITSATFAASKLVDVTVNSTAAEPSNASATALATGADGSIADSDYDTAIDKCAVERACNILFLDVYNDTRNGYLKQHAADTTDKMVILAGAEGDSVSTAVTDVADYRDTDGRIIYAYPWVETSIDSVLTMTSPASWLASIMSQIAANVDPAYAKNVQYMAGATGLKLQLTRANYISLKEAGICAFEYDGDLGGYKPKSGVVTQISDSSKVMIFRRRMADFLTDSCALFLKNYQNAPNTRDNRDAVNAALRGFVKSLEDSKMLPSDSEVTSGKAKLIDTESLNTDSSIAAGFFKILWKQRIFSSMRYIVIQAEIGESVVVTNVG